MILTPAIILAIVWFLLVVLALLLLISIKETDEPIQVSDKWRPDGPLHQYLIRVCFDRLSQQFSLKTTLNFCVYDSKRQLITRFIAPPKVFQKHSYFISETERVMSFIVKRKRELKGMAYISMGHNSLKGHLFVAAIEVQYITNEQIMRANVLKDIKPVELMANADDYDTFQWFPVTTIGNKSKIKKALPLPRMRSYEWMAFAFNLFNAIPMLCLFVIICDHSLCRLYPSDQTHLIWYTLGTGLASNLIALIMVLVLIYIYYLVVKYHHLRTVYTYIWLITRSVYVAVVVIAGAVFGGLVAANEWVKGWDEDSQFRYSDTILYAYLITLVVVLPIGSLIVWCCCRLRTDETTLLSDFLLISSSQITDSSSLKPRSSSSPPSTSTVQSLGSNV